jgi:porin
MIMRRNFRNRVAAWSDSYRRLLLSTACASACLGGGAALAQTAAPTDAADDSGFSTTALWHQSNLLGDMGGLRSALGVYGISLTLSGVDEVLGNVSGGIRQGAEYDGLTTLTLQLDTSKRGWDGGLFNISALQIHGRNFSQYYLDSLQTSSGIEADQATRLWELWFQQQFLDNSFDIKVGQQSIDQEFIVSSNAALFMNTMMGWPAVPSYDMPGGGPAYPLSTPGVRFRAEPTSDLTVLAGVFNGDPTGGKPDGDAAGTMFDIHSGLLAIGEIQYAINQPAQGDMVSPDQKPGLPGTYRLGVWYDSEKVPDQRFDNTGLSLASPNTTGIPALHRGDFSLYGVADQMLWQPDPQSTKSLNAFLRVMTALPSDRNLLTFSANGGLTLKAPFEGRDNDIAGIGFGYVKISSRAADLDRDYATFNGGYYPIRSSETFLELTYQYAASPWWQIQPDFQYIFNPGGGVLNPANPTKRIGDAAVFGLRSTITF